MKKNNNKKLVGPLQFNDIRRLSCSVLEAETAERNGYLTVSHASHCEIVLFVLNAYESYDDDFELWGHFFALPK